MKLRICLALLLAAISVILPLKGATAQNDSPKLLIVEVAPNGKEFVEIYNPGEKPVSLECFSLQYRVATSTQEDDWSNKYRFECDGVNGQPAVVLAPHSRLLFAAYDELTVEDELRIASGLRDAGGQLRIAKKDGSGFVVNDQLGYGDAVTGEDGKAPAKVPAEGHSLKRVVNEDGLFFDTNNNAVDFDTSDTPTPQRDDIDVEIEPNEPEPENPEQEEPGKGSGEYAKLQLNEFLPDPAPPEQDDTDEFVEIYNPTDAEVSLKGYSIQSGGNFQYSFTFGDGAVIAAQGFATVRSGDTDITLSNSGGKVRLLAPDETVQEEVSYPLAIAGQSFNRASDGWLWSVQPSPGAANSIVALPPPPAKATKAATAKKPTTPKVSITKPKATSAAKKSSTKAATTSSSPLSTPAALDNSPNLWILLPIGMLIVGYALYEYRKDIAMWWRKLQLAVKTKE